MSTTNISGKNRLLFACVGLRAARCAALFCMLVVSGWALAASSHYPSSSRAGSEMAPWIPDVVTAIDEYVPVAAFNSGRLILDHFGASNNLDQLGLVTAQLANGDMVVAGLVPDGFGGGSCSDGTKLCSIGLVRYNASGQRITWPNAGDSGRSSNNYVVYGGLGPQYNDGFQYLRQVSVRGHYIDVLVDLPDILHPALTLGHRNVEIVTFYDDGELQFVTSVFGVGDPTLPEADNEDFYGAQMVLVNPAVIYPGVLPLLMVAATAYDSGGPYIAVSTMVIDNSGRLTPATLYGGHYGGNNFSTITRYFGPPGLCAAPVAGRCEVTAKYMVKDVAKDVDTVYIAGDVHYHENDWDVITIKITPSGKDGSFGAPTGIYGWVRTAFNQALSTKKDLAAGIYVYGDEVYLAAQVAQHCFGAIGMAKLNGTDGGLITAFGNGGKVVFGGQGNAPHCASPGGDYPTAISATYGRIGIAGYSQHDIPGFPNLYDPMLAVVDATSGTVLDFDTHPVTRADGTRYGDAVLYSIYGGPLPISPFTVAGNGRDAANGNTLSYLAGKFVPVSADGIFANGFEN